MQQHLVHQRVNRRCRSNAEHEREYGGYRERWRLAKGAGGEAEIVGEIPQPSSHPDVPHFFLNLRDATQLQQSLPVRFLCRQPGSLEIVASPLDMVAKLAVQAIFQPLASEPIHQLSHRLPSLKMS